MEKEEKEYTMLYGCEWCPDAFVPLCWVRSLCRFKNEKHTKRRADITRHISLHKLNLSIHEKWEEEIRIN